MLAAAVGSLALTPAAARADTAAARHAAALPKPKLTISAPAVAYAYGAKVTFTVTLGPTVKHRRVTLYASRYGEHTGVMVASANVGTRAWHPSYKMTIESTFTVVFAGDSHNAATTAHVRLHSYAKVAERLGGSGKTAKVGGITFHVYSGSGTLTLYSEVSPRKRGECLEPESQQMDGSKWVADSKYGCDALDASSNDAAAFTLAQAAGARYRIRGDYLAAKKDRGNLSTDGGWLYFEVEK
jgi:hypothetical protein